jgi:hypothetical protein
MNSFLHTQLRHPKNSYTTHEGTGDKCKDRNNKIMTESHHYELKAHEGDDWVSTINNSVAVLIEENIIYVSSYLRSFANGNKHNSTTALSEAATFAPELWFGNILYYKLLRWK